MHQPDKAEYYSRRAATEADAASHAASDRAADIHRTLASMYRALAEAPREQVPG